jgi:hypothetical protein
MISTQRARASFVAAALVTSLCATQARALYLDDDQNFNLRMRMYSQIAIRTDKSQTDTTPVTKAGQLVQHRNFFNPELDAKLTPYTSWMKNGALNWMAPDDLTFRIAGWGFYDGIYDYGASQFGDNLENINPNFRNYSTGICKSSGAACSSNADCTSVPGELCVPRGAWFMRGSRVIAPATTRSVQNPDGSTTEVPIPPGRRFIDNLDQLLPGADLQEPREVYSRRQRVNELYLSYSKGPFFFRIGRQVISWGEADTIALLDQNNPFDLTLAAPGLFMDLEESRIPLWTIRSSYNLFENLGPFSSGFVEAYWVPGWIDTETGFLPMLTASPYSPRGRNPQFSSGFPNDTYQFILFDELPSNTMDNSRYGFRFQTVVNRAYTVQAWLYTHFPTTPAPVKGPLATIRPGTAGSRTPSGSPLFLVRTIHDLTTVYGLATTFFFEPLDGIVRIEGEFFENEPGMIPQFNLNIKAPDDIANGIGIPGTDPVTSAGTIPYADILRWEVGFDRFFFLRFLNPTNSFILSTSNVGAWNLDETSRKDFRFGGLRKPGRDVTGGTPVPDDFVQQKAVESFFQITMLTDYMHGRLSPQCTFIQNVRGTYAIHPQLTYRWTDWLLFKLDYIHIGGEFQSLGFFKDRDQIAARVTYQLN